MKLVEISESEFTKFERKNPYGNFFQSVKRAELRKRMKYGAKLLGLMDKEKLAGVALVIEHNHEAWVQMGPILDWEKSSIVKAFAKEFKAFAEQQGYWQIEVFPPVIYSLREIDGSVRKQFNRKAIFKAFNDAGYKHEGFTVEIENKAQRWLYTKDLSGMKTIYDAEMSFNGSTRKKLRHTRREVYVRRLTDKAQLGEWIEALRESNNRNGVPTRPLKYFEDIWDCFGDEAIFIEVRRRDNDELVSSEVDILHPNEMVAFLAGSIEKNKKFNGSTAIKGWQIEECLKIGQKRLNLYGMEGKFSLDNPLLRFKGGLRGVTEEYVGGFRCTLKPGKMLAGKVLGRAKRLVKR